MMKFCSKIALVVAMCALASAVFPVVATGEARAASSSAQQKAKVEGQKNSLEKKLSKLQRELNEKEAASEAAAEELKKADKAISLSNNKIKRLQSERSRVEKRLRELAKDKRQVHQDLEAAEETIALIARAQYLNLTKKSWQLYIDGSNPNRISREKAQLKYLAYAQNKALQRLEGKQQKIQRVAGETANRKSELLRISEEERRSRSELYQEKLARQRAVSALKKDIASQQQQIDRLKKDQARLGSLISSLDKKIAKEKLEAARRAKAAAKNQKPQPVVASLPKGGFAKLKGRLLKPVDGRIIGRFGTKRSGTALWQGIRIPAPEGAAVKASAPGVVVFSDWLRGYGNIVIIDHGDTYMTVYANNESTYKNTGEKVSQGETIGTVGTSGGGSEPGLYFEIRYKGKPINPVPWFRK